MTHLSLLATAFCLAALSSATYAAAPTKQIQIKGSDTEVNMVQMLAETFMKQQKEVGVAVTGGGSGTGIAAILNNSGDLANSSRAMKDEEISQARAKGLEPKRIIFATDALAVIVNEANPISSLTIDQLSKIFKHGESSEDPSQSWKEYGGAEEPVSLYGRQSNSGTFSFFREQVVKGDYNTAMKGMNGNSQIVEAVSQDKGGIGYVGIGYAIDTETHKPAKGIKVLLISKDTRSKGVSPADLKAVKKGLYPITRPLYQYFVKADPGILDFIKFELGPVGRKMITKEGFYETKSEWRAENEKVLKELARR